MDAGLKSLISTLVFAVGAGMLWWIYQLLASTPPEEQAPPPEDTDRDG